MANNLYNTQVSPKGYKRGGGVKKPGKVKSFFGKIRKKIAPTFSEQFGKAKKEGKKTFKSTRDDKTKGKLEYNTLKKSEVAKKIAANKTAEAKRKEGKGGGADSGAKGVYNKATGSTVSSKGQAFAKARKEGKKTFMYQGKKYTTLLKGEKPNKKLPELSGKTSRKIKKFIGA
tara:strand:+ start:585 stop:1103 length:519 start_codon:yes stop_codon:yes gene_type:complete